MKSLTRNIVFFGGSLVAASLSPAGEYTDRILEISRGFENPDTEVQYTARRDLEILVSENSAPRARRKASKLADDLVAALSEPRVSREAKKYILRQLARVGTARSVAALSELMLGGDDLLAENARKAIESIPGGKANAALKAAYPKMNVEGKRDILKSLAHRSESSSVAFIGNALENEASSVGETAAWALGAIGGSRALGVLQSARESTSTGKVRAAIERSLLENASVGASTLRDLHETGSDVAIRRGALIALIDRADRSVVGFLEQGLASEDRALRTIAIEAALSSGEDRYQSIVLNAVSSMGPDDLTTVLGGLGHVDAETAETIGLQAFEGGDESIQLIILELLGRVGSDRSVDLLLDVFDTGNRARKIKASAALAQIDAPGLDDRIASMLKSSDSKQARLAQEALVHRNVPGGKEALLSFASGSDSGLARGALQTLSVIANETDLDGLFERSQSASAESKRLIEALLKKLAPEIGSESLQEKVASL